MLFFHTYCMGNLPLGVYLWWFLVFSVGTIFFLIIVLKHNTLFFLSCL